ncbi:MAG: hypothetical protein LBD91_00685 [Prevotellaceae bacterium]|jgi:hypothetical protein|nr:hypothetical protein [Prevotellaceae bacterium]
MQNKLKKTLSSLLNKRTLMFCWFVALAFVAWFINRLSNEYRAEMLVNVCLYDSQHKHESKLFTTSALPVIARANGFYILRQRLSTPPTVMIDIKNKRPRQTGTHYYLLTATVQDEIRQLLSDDMQIESYARDTLFFQGVKPDDIPDDENMIYGNHVVHSSSN